MLTDGDGGYTNQASCFASRGWPIYAFGLGSANDTLLQGIATATSGAYKRLPTSELGCEFQRVRAKIAGEPNPPICITNTIQQGQRLPLPDFTVKTSQQSATFSTSWGGSDIFLTVTSPSGRRIDRNTNATDVTKDNGANFEAITVANPEPGAWKVELYGAVIPVSGEEVVFSGITIPAPDAMLTLSATTGGLADASPAGSSYSIDTVIRLTATAAPGYILSTWVVDGIPQGWANPLQLTMDRDHSVAAIFASRTNFSDVPSSSAASNAIIQLAARGLVNGYTAAGCNPRGLPTPCFGPADEIQRAQLAAIIVRAFSWQRDPGLATPFSDISQLNPELQAALGILANKGIAKGYGDGTFGPLAVLSRAQAVSLVTRSMVEAGYWQQQTAPQNLYGGVLNGTGHENDVATFVHYAGPVIGTTNAQQTWSDWTSEAEREWFARLFWLALDSYFGVDRVP